MRESADVTHEAVQRRLHAVVGERLPFSASGTGARGTVLLVPGVEVVIILADGRSLVGRVVERDDRRAAVVPWGTTSRAVVELSQVELAAVVAGVRWEVTARIGAKQRKTWR